MGIRKAGMRAVKITTLALTGIATLALFCTYLGDQQAVMPSI